MDHDAHGRYRRPPLRVRATERNALDAMRRCTSLPAKHLGLDHMIGSLEVGKRADLIMVDLRSPNLCPMGDDPIATLVYNANCHDVHSVMVDRCV